MRWKVASDLRFRVAISEPKTPSFCEISGDLASSTRKSLAIAIVRNLVHAQFSLRDSCSSSGGSQFLLFLPLLHSSFRGAFCSTERLEDVQWKAWNYRGAFDVHALAHRIARPKLSIAIAIVTHPPERFKLRNFSKRSAKNAAKFWRNFSQIFVLQFPGKMAAKNITKNPRHFPRCTKLSFFTAATLGASGPKGTKSSPKRTFSGRISRGRPGVIRVAVPGQKVPADLRNVGNQAFGCGRP